MTRPRILFLDAHDSFSNNIVALLATLLEADVDIVPIDASRFDPKSAGFRDELNKELRCYDAVVCGPGPGSPDLHADVGLIKHVWELEDEHLLPVLGICLGFQSLAISCGASIEKIPGGGLHGMIRDIHFPPETTDTEGNIFDGVTSFKATLYHSLFADIGQGSMSGTDWMRLKWTSPSHLQDIVPLAWVEETRNGLVERLLMGMKHRTKPFWGLQYHPESVCSETAGYRVVSNWFKEALKWSSERRRITTAKLDRFAPGARKPSLLSQLGTQLVGKDAVHSAPFAGDDGEFSNFALGSSYSSTTIPLPTHVEVPDVVELLQRGRHNHVILDSASAHTNRIGLDVRGRYSIIGLDIEESLRLEYHVGDAYAIARLPSSSASGKGNTRKIDFGRQQTIWHLLADFMAKRRLSPEEAESPFMGGFMGYVTYELGLRCIDVDMTKFRDHGRPDLCFAWITRSIVVDHLEGTLHIQYLHPSVPKATEWVQSVGSTLQRSPLWTDGSRVDGRLREPRHLTPPSTPTGPANPASVDIPNAGEYESKVRRCQDFIAAGDSYELCLTDQTSITRPKDYLGDRYTTASANSWAPASAVKTPSSWQLYRSLRSCQPAPFGSYICLGGATLISSSPERFLEYNASGLCSMRPMKGTVRKSEAVTTLAQAEKILHTPKEEAENLMIVDLVRHDLHSVCGPGNVRVPQLMKVEEYASVFQMISVVEGQLPTPVLDKGHADQDQGYTGLDVLAASLPPGSMTGAPKKRSCEILHEIEGQRERSLYSGVVGYMDVAGRGDWSVTIRSLFRWDDETVRRDDGSETEVWHIGAGGAVTALSTPEGERDEMFTKLKGPLGVVQERA
ncbi:aminodeoxychorismate synthase [Xylariales sp. AK1849]|nr:aminodeoxychorismate synthase [Xylariales sp. AK1849]